MYQDPLALSRQILDRADALTQLRFLQAAKEDKKSRHMEFREWVTEDVKAEFINGQLVIYSPVKRRYWKTSDFLSRLLSYFASTKNVGVVDTEKVMIAITRNDYEPGLVFFSDEK